MRYAMRCFVHYAVRYSVPLKPMRHRHWMGWMPRNGRT
jgi:hypothetical protein